ncbi:MAG: HRDC domain-containing protein [Verrucomicrobiota bacterium]
MIDTDKKLAELLAQLSGTPWVALDTEADSLHAYPEKLCLLQISFPGADVLVDPLARIDLAPLWAELRQHELIFHAADYDLRLLRKIHGFVPEKIFDTMLAARLLGEKEFSLTNLVANFLEVQLEKGSQKADWAQRPLTERMENYARNDTRYLKPLSDLLRKKLEETGRLSWHRESCACLIEDCAELPSADVESWRIKGSSRLGRMPLAILRELWLWREKEAIAANKPPYFVLSHEVLVEIASGAGTARGWLEFLPRHLSSRRSTELEQAVERGLRVAHQNQPQIMAHVVTPRPTDAEKRRFLELSKRRDEVALKLGIDPTLIASRATLGLLSQDWEHFSKELMNWQRELLS